MADRKANYPVTSGSGVVLEAVPPDSPYDYAPSLTKGNSAGRPVTTSMNRTYFDTDLGYRIYWNQMRGVWTDFVGKAV